MYGQHEFETNAIPFKNKQKRKDLSAVPYTYPFVRIIIIVGDFFLSENEPSLLVVQWRCFLLLLRSSNEDFFQYVI